MLDIFILVLVSWTLLSVMTALAVGKMIAAGRGRERAPQPVRAHAEPRWEGSAGPAVRLT